MADLLWDVPQTNSAILCRRQEYISGGMGAQAPDRSVHMSVHQDVARCILLSYFNDLCIPGPHKDFTLTQKSAKKNYLKIHMMKFAISFIILLGVILSVTYLSSAYRANAVYNLSGF